MRNQKGFTLIELMIVVAILAIIAAIATPAYQEYTNGTNVNTTQTTPDVNSELVCRDSGGSETLREPAIPGERWYYEAGTYVTNDAKGNPRVVRLTDNTRTCEIQ